MLRLKDTLLASLALASGVLALVVWRQRMEIRELARVRPAPSGAVTIRSAVTRSFPLPPRRAQRHANAPRMSGEFGDFGERTDGLETRPAPSPPRRTGALVRLMENPEFVQALGRQRQAMLDSRFADLFRRLNLDSDELANFKHLLAEKENVALDVVTVSESSPDGPLSNDSLRAGVRAAQAQVEQAIASSLGSERYEIYRDYERTIAQRATVAMLQQRLSYTAAPLTPPQAEAMVKILATNAPAMPPETIPALSVVVRAGVPEVVPMLPTNAATGRVTEEVVVQAQTVLAPTQVAALREIQTEQQAAVRTAELIREALPIIEEIPGLGLLLLQ